MRLSPNFAKPPGRYLQAKKAGLSTDFENSENKSPIR
jgi:hypothetical protein